MSITASRVFVYQHTPTPTLCMSRRKQDIDFHDRGIFPQHPMQIASATQAARCCHWQRLPWKIGVIPFAEIDSPSHNVPAAS